MEISELEYKTQLLVNEFPIIELLIVILPCTTISTSPDNSHPSEKIKSPETKIFPGPLMVQELKLSWWD